MGALSEAYLEAGAPLVRAAASSCDIRVATAATRAAPRPLPSSEIISWYWKKEQD